MEDLSLERENLSLDRAPAVNFVVTKLSDITDNIVPFFVDYHLVGSKADDFLDFKKIATYDDTKSSFN